MGWAKRTVLTSGAMGFVRNEHINHAGLGSEARGRCDPEVRAASLIVRIGPPLPRHVRGSVQDANVVNGELVMAD
jgi:hypothetical protein